MITQDKQLATGRVQLEVYRLSKKRRFIVKLMSFFGIDNISYIRKYGRLKYNTGFIKNSIMNAGRAAETSLLGGLGAAAFTYLAVGTSTTAVAVTQTALGAEITTNGLSRASVIPTQVTTSVTNDTLQLQKSFSVTGSSTIEEIGIFNAPSAGTMLGRALTGSKDVANGDTAIATYQVTMG